MMVIRLASTMPAITARRARAAAIAAACLVVLLAALLRLDAFVGKYGALDHPAWARVATRDIAPLAARLRPATLNWPPERNPYVGGDPINYLKRGREMGSFYEGNGREPGFPFLTRLGLWLLDGQDAAVSLASGIGSVLAVLAAYLLAGALASRAAGVAAALLMAIELEAVTWAPDGWRDDTFAALVALSAWALIRLHQRPSHRRALVAGLCFGAACLTRITAVAFILPGCAWCALDGARDLRGPRAKAVGAALLVAALLVAPYLINCARATGDPLYALNYHTTYYRYAEGLDTATPMTASAYLREKLAARPIAMLDKGFIGVFVHPFASQWHGWDRWSPRIGQAASALAAAGVALLLFVPQGRLLLVILLTSMLPYAFTWDVGSGRAWRFTMHVLPLYLSAAAVAAATMTTMLAGMRRGLPRPSRGAVARVAGQLALVASLAFAGTALYYGLPWLVVREGVAAAAATSIETGGRDLLFYRAGWSPPHHDGIWTRVSVSPWGVIRFPLVARRAYDLVLRLDPVAPEANQRVRLRLNQHPIGSFELTWSPERVGSYRLRLPADAVRAGSNELVLIPDPVVEAPSAGPRFAWLGSTSRIGVRVWYVRISP